MNRSDVQEWLDRYVAAWRSNDPEMIKALFTEDAVYRFVPYERADSVVRGHAAIVAAWLGEADDPDGWEARYEPFVVADDLAVATGTSRYRATADEPERTYHNAFLLRFAADGRCSAFTEYYMLETPTE